MTASRSDIGRSDVGGSDVGGSDVGGSDVGGSDVGGSDVGRTDVGRPDTGRAAERRAAERRTGEGRTGEGRTDGDSRAGESVGVTDSRGRRRDAAGAGRASAVESAVTGAGADRFRTGGAVIEAAAPGPATRWPGSPIAVVGIGADGWPGLGAGACAAIEGADVVFGSARQLELLPARVGGERRSWPSPLLPALPDILLRHADRRVCVLASGDPMFYGIGVTLARLFGPASLRVLPQPSSASLACARLGWALADTPVVSVVGRPLAGVLPELTDGRRVLVLSADETTPVALAQLLCANGLEGSRLTVLEQLGGPSERIGTATAAELAAPIGDPLYLDPIADSRDEPPRADQVGVVRPGRGRHRADRNEGGLLDSVWHSSEPSHAGRRRAAEPVAVAPSVEATGVSADGAGASGIDPRAIDPLNIVAIDTVASPGAARRTRVPGLPDESFGGDGQLTKAEVRALTLSALAPAPGELLWDIGGGSGSIAIEWCRAHPACRAIGFERLERRRAAIAANAEALGVPQVTVRGEAMTELAANSDGTPDAIFVGGGLTQEGLLESCLDRLRPGGRLVANAVTAETEALLVRSAAQYGGKLRKFQIYRAEPLGGFTAWRPHLPVAQWVWTKSG
ncbi:precorrin-6y C5,15-methyltransferase (decarboxylating) subunit CbiE [Nocardia higoensis]|uniref:Precorrin-6y C5,15-methyltransferase (Decarboxylating) subunit CbiE n=1 Tax=Nocardia higoensis TaxID=228599 RepID=A0ABS0D6A1_9NOCA|nr:precorrin-6y C5,15-methyltransferase (decarboxylating) subunit CbiE [Nocardia higoensis]